MGVEGREVWNEKTKREGKNGVGGEKKKRGGRGEIRVSQQGGRVKKTKTGAAMGVRSGGRKNRKGGGEWMNPRGQRGTRKENFPRLRVKRGDRRR